MKKISVLGFGKIGQAVTANILEHDISVIGIDTNQRLINDFSLGRFSTNEPEIESILYHHLKTGSLKITNDYSHIKDSCAVIICIPLLTDTNNKILEAPFLNCFEQISPFLFNKCLVSIETTMPIGFTQKKVLKILERNRKKHNVDFDLIYSSERIKSGTMLKQLRENPKIIGGINEEAAKTGKEIYNLFFKKELVKLVSSAECAEMVKLAGMVYRDINIAISNQLAQYAHKAKIDFTEVLAHSNSDKETFLLSPGIGVGGHCTPVYPYFIIENFKEKELEFTLAIEAREINDFMASYAVEVLDGRINHKKALILGLGFRPDVKEDTFSTSYLLHKKLKEKGFEVLLHDPHFSDEEIKARKFTPACDLYSTNAQVVFLVTNHSCYKNLNWSKLKKGGCIYFVDGRNSFDKKKVETEGINYIGIGK